MKKVTLYTLPTCPFCQRAKALLSQLEVPFTDIDVSQDQAKRQEMSEKYNWQTVPMIVIGDEFIGGFDDMAALHEKGELMPKIQA